MQRAVVLLAHSLVPEQISVCPCIKKSLVTLPLLFPHRECHRTVTVFLFYGHDQLCDPVIRIPGVLAPLEHKGPEPKGITFPAALHNFFPAQTVTFRPAVSFSDPAVVAVVFAVIGKLDQSSDVNAVSVIFFPHPRCFAEQISGKLLIPPLDQRCEGLPVKGFSCFQTVNTVK